jgi:hypothetical protein
MRQHHGIVEHRTPLRPSAAPACELSSERRLAGAIGVSTLRQRNSVGGIGGAARRSESTGCSTQADLGKLMLPSNHSPGTGGVDERPQECPVDSVPSSGARPAAAGWRTRTRRGDRVRRLAAHRAEVVGPVSSPKAKPASRTDRAGRTRALARLRRRSRWASRSCGCSGGPVPQIAAPGGVSAATASRIGGRLS